RDVRRDEARRAEADQGSVELRREARLPRHVLGYGAVATPAMAGRVKRGAFGSCVCSTLSTTNPAASIEPSVGRLHSQPTKKWLKPFIRSCRRATDGSPERTCSRKRSRPPGRSTRRS